MRLCAASTTGMRWTIHFVALVCQRGLHAGSSKKVGRDPTAWAVGGSGCYESGKQAAENQLNLTKLSPSPTASAVWLFFFPGSIRCRSLELNNVTENSNGQASVG